MIVGQQSIVGVIDRVLLRAASDSCVCPRLLSICAPIRCICGLLKDKCRILVTHQLQHLRAADHILLLQEVSQLSTKDRLSLYSCLTSPSLSGPHRDSGHLQGFSALRPRCHVLDEERRGAGQILTNSRIGETVDPQPEDQLFIWQPPASRLQRHRGTSRTRSHSRAHFPMVENPSLKPLMSFCFFHRQKRFSPCRRRLELRETLVGTFTTSISLRAATSWF